MRDPRPLLSPTRLLGRFVSGGAVALVLLLTVLSASPLAHAWIHHHDPAAQAVAHSSDCVVSQFAHGLLAADASVALAAIERPTESLLIPATGSAIADPVRRLPPACGPPSA